MVVTRDSSKHVGAIMYKILVDNRDVWKRYVDQIVAHCSPRCPPNSKTPDNYIISLTDEVKSSTKGALSESLHKRMNHYHL